MKCAKCGNAMVEGNVFIGGGGISLLMGGLSYGNLTFKGTEWSEYVVQESSDVLPAHYCNSCGAVTIETRRRGLSSLETKVC
jgi:hypothetical protein